MEQKRNPNYTTLSQLGYSLGKVLQNKRLQDNISLEQISKRLNISETKLDALEKNDYSKFASQTQVKGFLKNYVNELGLDWTHVEALYRREASLQDEQEAPTLKQQGEKVYQLLSSRRGVLATIAIVIVLGLGLYFFGQVRNLLAPPELKLNEPIEVSANYSGEYVSESPTLQLKGTTEAQTVVRINQNTLDVDPTNFTFSTREYPVTTETYTLELTATSPFGRKSHIILDITGQTEKSQDEQTSEEN